jgi:hypothetical protein
MAAGGREDEIADVLLAIAPLADLGQVAWTRWSCWAGSLSLLT